MTVAKITTYNKIDLERIKKRLKKGAGRFTGKFFAPPSKVPGRVDYPAIPEILKAQKRRRKLLDANVTRIGR